MTDHQHDCLAWFEQNHIGATPFEGKWLWPIDIRNNSELADRFWEKIDREARVVIKVQP